MLDLVKAISGIAGQVLDKFLPDKLSDEQREQMRLRAEKMARDAVLQDEELFRKFVLEYEGRARDMPRLIQVLRASVRPVLTYLLAGTTVWLVWQGKEIPQMLFQLNLISLGFWYGERAARKIIRTKQGKE